MEGPRPPAPWSRLIPAGHWRIQRKAIQEARRRGVRFLLGGSFGMAVYTGRCADHRRLDLFIRPEDGEVMAQALAAAGFEDVHPRLPYDRGVMHRTAQGEVEVEAAWCTANRRARVDEGWFARGVGVQVGEEPLLAAPPEELIRVKVYVLQRDRCEWTDVLNLLAVLGPTLDWDHLLARLGEDAPLLDGVLAVFEWICPARGRSLPTGLRERARALGERSDRPPEVDLDRVRLLDRRPWFDAAREDGSPELGNQDPPS